MLILCVRERGRGGGREREKERERERETAHASVYRGERERGGGSWGTFH